jgi:hypothetical protein
MGNLGGPIIEDPVSPRSTQPVVRVLGKNNQGVRMFCGEDDLINHLFFELPNRFWELISEPVGFTIGCVYESIAKCWLCNKKVGVVNMATFVFCWGVWKLKTDMHFQGFGWRGLKQI